MSSAATSRPAVEVPSALGWAQRLEKSRAESARLRKRAILARLDAALVMVAVEDARLHRDIDRYLDAADR